MYNPDYYGIQNLGWTCPKCGRSYAPTVSQCLYCNDSRVVFATRTKPEWIYNEDTRTGSIYNNEWWKYPSSISWEDMVRGTGLLEDD